MESGSIVEYIDRQKIMCAVILEVKNTRLRLLTENNREVNFSANRLLHKDKAHLDLAMGRDKMVDALKGVAIKNNRGNRSDKHNIVCQAMESSCASICPYHRGHSSQK